VLWSAARTHALELAPILARARAERAPLRLVALAADLARRARRERWDHVHGSFATFPAWTAWATARLAGVPFSFTGHAYDIQEPRPWLGRLIGEAAFVRAIAAEGATRLRKLAVDAHARARVRVSHLGVDVRRFAPGGSDADPPEIVSVARLGPTKGIDVLVEAASRLARDGRRFRLRVLGDGPLRPALERRIVEEKLGTFVRLEGEAGRDEVASALRRATVFALPCVAIGAGRRHDGLPVALLEAMAAARAVVSTTVGGIPEAIASGRNGRLVRAGDAGSLARCLGELLDSPGERRRLGRAARGEVLARFRLEDSAGRLARLLLEPGAAPRRGSPRASAPRARAHEPRVALAAPGPAAS
jgi:glycosyltransferase involved in cell wall biosynthesis